MSEMGPPGTPPSSSRLCQQYYYLVGLPVVGGGPGSHFRLLVVHTMFIHTCDLALPKYRQFEYVSGDTEAS